MKTITKLRLKLVGSNGVKWHFEGEGYDKRLLINKSKARILDRDPVVGEFFDVEIEEDTARKGARWREFLALQPRP